MTVKRKAWILLILLAMLPIVVSSGCGPAKAPAEEAPAGPVPIDTTIKDIQDRGVLRVGILVDAPWGFKDLESNEWKGVNVDIAHWIADQLEVEVEFVETDWKRVVPDVVTGKVDFCAPGLSATPVRAMVIDFTKPYASFGYIYPVMADRDDLNTLEDLNSPDITVALHAGATSQLCTEFYMPEAQITPVTQIGYSALLAEILSGRSDTMPLVSILVPAYQAKFPELKFIPSTDWRNDAIYGTPVVFGIQKGRPDFVHFMNNCIDNMMLRGVIDRSFETWLQPEYMIK